MPPVDPASSPPPTAAIQDALLARELTGAVARVLIEDPDPSARPSRFRSRLVKELGARADTHRNEIHLLTVALEERVPTRLRRFGVVGPDEIRDETVALAATRGLRAESAERCVRIWAGALEEVGAVSASQSQSGQSEGERSDPTAPMAPAWQVRAPEPVTPAPAPGPTWMPGVSTGAEEPTELPDGDRRHSDSAPSISDGPAAPGREIRRVVAHAEEATEIPDRFADPSATEVPDSSSVLADPVDTAEVPSRAPSGRGQPASSVDAVDSALPTTEQTAFRERNPLLRWSVVGVCLAVALPIVLLAPGPIGTPVLIAVLVIPTLLMNVVISQGFVTFTDTGISYRKTRGRGDSVTVAWGEVTGVTDGRHPRIETTQGPIWLGWNKADLAAAVRRRLG